MLNVHKLSAASYSAVFAQSVVIYANLSPGNGLQGLQFKTHKPQLKKTTITNDPPVFISEAKMFSNRAVEFQQLVHLQPDQQPVPAPRRHAAAAAPRHRGLDQAARGRCHDQKLLALPMIKMIL